MFTIPLYLLCLVLFVIPFPHNNSSANDTFILPHSNNTPENSNVTSGSICLNLSVEKIVIFGDSLTLPLIFKVASESEQLHNLTGKPLVGVHLCNSDHRSGLRQKGSVLVYEFKVYSGDNISRIRLHVVLQGSDIMVYTLLLIELLRPEDDKENANASRYFAFKPTTDTEAGPFNVQDGYTFPCWSGSDDVNHVKILMHHLQFSLLTSPSPTHQEMTHTRSTSVFCPEPKPNLPSNKACKSHIKTPFYAFALNLTVLIGGSLSVVWSIYYLFKLCPQKAKGLRQILFHV